MVAVAGAVVLFVADSSSRSPAKAGHGGDAPCPTANEHCLARAQMFPGDGRIVGLVATIDGAPGIPCAQSTCDNPGDSGCGGFSAFPLWIPATRSGHGSTDTVPEIGVVRFDSPDGGLRPRVYSYCNKCGQSDGWQLHSFAEAGMRLLLWYDPTKNEWGWYLKEVGVAQVRWGGGLHAWLVP